MQRSHTVRGSECGRLCLQISVVTETRLYNSWGGGGPGRVGLDSGIIRGKRALSKLHYDMGSTGFTQVSRAAGRHA